MSIDTMTAWCIGNTYYVKAGQPVPKFYTQSGNYPEDLKRNLKIVTRYIYEKYILKKEVPGKDSLEE